MMGLGKPVTGPWTKMAIVGYQFVRFLGCTSLFWGVELALICMIPTVDGRNPAPPGMYKTL